MAYTTGLMNDRITILNRTDAVAGDFGLDSTGVDFESAGTFWASVEWQKGKTAMTAGALDSYGVVLVRMRWNDVVTMRSRMVYDSQTYQIIPETFHVDKQVNTIQFMAQILINNS